MTSVSNTLVIEPKTQAWLDALAAADSPPLYGSRRAMHAKCPVRPDERRSRPASPDIEDLVSRADPRAKWRSRSSGATRQPPPGDRPFARRGLDPRRQRHARTPRPRAHDRGQGRHRLRQLHARSGGHYPTQNEQAYTVLEWAVDNARGFGCDGSRVALVGESVGGNMTAALTLMAKRRGGPKLAAQGLFYPVTDANFGTGTYDRYAEAPWLTRAAMSGFGTLTCPTRTGALRSRPHRFKRRLKTSATCRRR